MFHISCCTKRNKSKEEFSVVVTAMENEILWRGNSCGGNSNCNSVAVVIATAVRGGEAFVVLFVVAAIIMLIFIFLSFFMGFLIMFGIGFKIFQNHVNIIKEIN